MKKLLILLLCALLCVPALASSVPAAFVPVGQLCPLSPDAQTDLDGDGEVDKIEYTVEYDEETGSSPFRLVIGTSQLDGEGDDLTGQIWAYRPEGIDDVLLFLADRGMSDDDWSHVYSYYQGEFRYLGGVGCMPEDLAVTAPNLLTGTARGSILHTWFRPADYVIAANYEEPSYARRATAICEMPRSEYPMGTVVTLRRDLDLQVSRTNSSHAYTLRAGEKAVIVSTDDIEWLYIVPLRPSYEFERTAGWLHTLIGGYSVSIDGDEISTYDLFDGLFYAD